MLVQKDLFEMTLETMQRENALITDKLVKANETVDKITGQFIAARTPEVPVVAAVEVPVAEAAVPVEVPVAEANVAVEQEVPEQSDFFTEVVTETANTEVAAVK